LNYELNKQTQETELKKLYLDKVKKYLNGVFDVEKMRILLSKKLDFYEGRP